MKRTTLLGFAAVAVIFSASVALAQNVNNYKEQGGARTVVGGSLDVISGGEIDIESGGSLKLDGTTITATAAEINQSADLSGKVQVISVDTTLTTANCGQSVAFSSTSGLILTLPTVTTGCAFYVGVDTVATSSAHAVVTDSGADVIACGINELDVDTGDDGPYQADADTVNFGSSGTSSAVADFVAMRGIGSLWHCYGQANADGGITLSSS